jgi:L-asparaginase
MSARTHSSSKFKPIHFVITGGTIDSYYEPTKDAIIPNEVTYIPEVMNMFKLNNHIKFSVVCLKDSRDLTREDMQNIKQSVEESPHTSIIITHGTYTMPDSARFLKSQVKRKDQVIILTGAMVPIKGFTPSDGPFNLGFAIAKLEELKPGVYICMNGQVLDADEASKLISEGRFVSLYSIYAKP